MSVVVSPLSPGSVVGGKYRIENEIGQGGLGVVYEAEHLRLRQRVAIKVLAVDRSRREMLARFEREARAMARLTSPHVVAVHDVDVLDDGVPYIVMELLNGWDLHHELDRNGGVLTIAEAVRIVLEAAEGVAQAHEAGIIHRDLKPSNLFLAFGRERRTVKLLDFGVSKLDDDDEMTGTGVTLGTAAYMSPEHVRSSRSVDARSDLWSLGVILFRCLTGQLPFRGEGPLGTALAIVTEPSLEVSELRSDLSPALCAIVRRLLDKEPAKRFQSARELIFSLSHVTTDEDEDRISHSDETIVRPPPRGTVRSGVADATPTPRSPPLEATRSDDSGITQEVLHTSVATRDERRPRASRRVFGAFVVLVALLTLGGALFVLLAPARFPSASVHHSIDDLRNSDAVRALLEYDQKLVEPAIAPAVLPDAGPAAPADSSAAR